MYHYWKERLIVEVQPNVKVKVEMLILRHSHASYLITVEVAKT